MEVEQEPPVKTKKGKKCSGTKKKKFLHNDCPHFNFRAYEYVILCGRRDFVDMINLRTLRWEASWII